MKKVILLIILVLTLAGCTNINKSSIPDIVKDVQSGKSKISNQYRSGYKYYLPTSISVVKTNDLNETFTDGKRKYYLYVDLISYFNKVEYEYKINNDCYYSANINYNNKPGYLEVNQQNDKYLIEIMYNYAKIEVIVDKDNINKSIANSLIVLSTIKYNDKIIENMMGEDVLSKNEETFSIFDTNGGDSNFLDIVEEYGTYQGEESDVPDYDLIN